MKGFARKILCLVMVLLLCVAMCAPAWAATTCKLYVDDVLIGSEAPKTEEDPQVYMDVPPEVKNGVSYVPLRFVSELFGAEVNLTWGQVWVTLDGTLVSLTIGEKTATVNGQTLELAGASYAKNGRTMVPLRFISEAFGYKVNYANGKIWIKTPALVIDGQEIAALCVRECMTTGGNDYLYAGREDLRYFDRLIYRKLVSGLGQKLDAQEAEAMVYQKEYYGQRIYTFLDENGNALQQMYVYEPKNVAGYVALVYEAVQGQWYRFDEKALPYVTKWLAMMKGELVSSDWM